MNGETWEASYPNVDAVAGDASCHGVLGASLLDTLQDLKTQTMLDKEGGGTLDVERLSDQESDVEKLERAEKPPQLSEESMDRILSALGGSMAKFYSTPSLGTSATAPSVLLRGRVDHFNRRNNKWRIVVKDAQFRHRVDLGRNRRMRERPSLWDVSKADKDMDSQSPKLNLELLAFNDID